jgi:hypothetical protein
MSADGWFSPPDQLVRSDSGSGTSQRGLGSALPSASRATIERSLKHGPTHAYYLRDPPGGRGRRAGQGRAGRGRPERRAQPEADRECGRSCLWRTQGTRRQAGLLRTGIRTLGGALLGAATVGGLGALIDRSISAADAIGKTADKIGVGVEALQELRVAAKASGIEQHTLDMALQRFTRRAAEAAQGTGEANALAQMGIALRDQSGNLRRSEDLLGKSRPTGLRIAPWTSRSSRSWQRATRDAARPASRIQRSLPLTNWRCCTAAPPDQEARRPPVSRRLPRAMS